MFQTSANSKPTEGMTQAVLLPSLGAILWERQAKRVIMGMSPGPPGEIMDLHRDHLESVCWKDCTGISFSLGEHPS